MAPTPPDRIHWVPGDRSRPPLTGQLEAVHDPWRHDVRWGDGSTGPVERPRDGSSECWQVDLDICHDEDVAGATAMLRVPGSGGRAVAGSDATPDVAREIAAAHALHRLAEHLLDYAGSRLNAQADAELDGPALDLLSREGSADR